MAPPRRTEPPLRIGLLLESDRQLSAGEALADALARQGHVVHFLVQGETVKDRDGALGRLGEVHLSVSAGHAPGRQDRWSSLLRELLDRLEPLAGEEEEADEDRPASRRKTQGGGMLARLTFAALPADPDLATYLEQLDLDLLLLTPRSGPWSGRLDYLLACRRLGVRAALLAPVDAAPSGLETLAGLALIRSGGEGGGEGLGQTVTAIEAAAHTPVRPRPAIWPLTPALEFELAARSLKRFAEDRLGADVNDGVLLGLARRSLAVAQNAYARWIFPTVLQGLLVLLPRQRDLFRDLLSEQMDASEMSRLGWVEDALAEARRSGAPVMIGPWTGGVGHEILYWIPMLRWFRKYYNIDKSRIVVISRGGVKAWYTGILGHYLDLFDLVPIKRQEYRDDALRRIASSDAPPAAGKIEKEIYKEAARLVGAERFTSLHPQVMFKLFKRRWSGLAGETFVSRYTRLQSIGAEVRDATKRLGALPSDYVAVDFRFSEALPDTPQSRALVRRFVLKLSQAVDVFLIEPPLDAESGPMAGIGPEPRIHRIEKEIRPSEILAVQSGVIAGARAFVGTFGAMSYLGQALGRTVIGVKARDGQVASGERELAMIRPDPACRDLHLVDLEALEALIPALGGGDWQDTPVALARVLTSAALAPMEAVGLDG